MSTLEWNASDSNTTQLELKESFITGLIHSFQRLRSCEWKRFGGHYLIRRLHLFSQLTP